MGKAKRTITSSTAPAVENELTPEELKFHALNRDEQATYLRWKKLNNGNIDDWQLARKKVKKIIVPQYAIVSHPQGTGYLGKDFK